MHAVFFGIKRAHLEVVHRVSRRILKGCGLTAARFDLMRVVCLRPGARQVSIAWLLGVSAATVSRMLRSLEEIGLVERESDQRDARCRVVRPTAAGRSAVAAGMAAAITSREADRVVARCAVGDLTSARRGSEDETVAFIEASAGETDRLAEVVAAARRALFDRAPYRHPWRGGDLVPSLMMTIVDGRVQLGGESLLSDEWLVS